MLKGGNLYCTQHKNRI